MNKTNKQTRKPNGNKLKVLCDFLQNSHIEYIFCKKASNNLQNSRLTYKLLNSKVQNITTFKGSNIAMPGITKTSEKAGVNPEPFKLSI